MKEVLRRSQRPFDLDPFDAEDALSNGQCLTLSVFLAETAETLRRLSETVAESIVDSEPNVSLARSHADEPPNEEWTGSTSQMIDAIRTNNTKSISSYMTHLSRVIDRIGALFDDDKSRNEPMIVTELKKRKRGRPEKPRKQAMMEDSSTRMRLRFSALEGVKQEAVIQEIVDQGGPSRATAFRRKARGKKTSLS